MSAAAAGLARPDAARDIASEVLAAPAAAPRSRLTRDVQPDPRAGRRLHFVGIGGAGMSGLALVAKALGADGDRLRPRARLPVRRAAARGGDRPRGGARRGERARGGGGDRLDGDPAR